MQCLKIDIYKMPSININFLKSIKDYDNTYDNFIETGTYQGGTISSMIPYFKNLYTIEIKREFYVFCKKKYRRSKINFYLGDSSKVLKDILPTIRGKSVIFLDGHWSAGNTGKGDKDCPLYEEIENIVSLHKESCLIIVDDVRLFGMGPNKGNEVCNWEDINRDKILQIVDKRLKSFYFLPSELSQEDRMVIFLN